MPATPTHLLCAGKEGGATHLQFPTPRGGRTSARCTLARTHCGEDRPSKAIQAQTNEFTGGPGGTSICLETSLFVNSKSWPSFSFPARGIVNLPLPQVPFSDIIVDYRRGDFYNEPYSNIVRDLSHWMNRNGTTSNSKCSAQCTRLGPGLSAGAVGELCR